MSTIYGNSFYRDGPHCLIPVHIETEGNGDGDYNAPTRVNTAHRVITNTFVVL